MGLARITTLMSAASTYDLVDLDTVKTELGITDTINDAWLSQAITQVSASVARYCNRANSEAAQASFPIEGVQDLFYPGRDAYPYQFPGGVEPLQLSHWPIAGLTAIPTSGDTPNGAVLPFSGTAGVSAGQVLNAPNIAPGTTVQSLVANMSVTLTGSILGDIPSGTPVNFGMCVTIADPAGVNQVLVEGTDYIVDPGIGQLVRLDPFMSYPSIWRPVKTVVQYSGGYASIPDDVVDAVTQWVTQRWSDRGRDPNLKSIEEPGVGIKTWWVGGPPMSGGVPKEIATLLDKYRVPIIA